MSERRRPTRRDFLTSSAQMGMGLTALVLGGQGLSAQATAKSLITLSDLQLKGLCGLPPTGLTNNNFSYTKGPFALRYVNGERRLLFGAYGQSPRTEQGWSAQDMFELRMPSTLTTTQPVVGGSPIEECSLVSGRRWPASEWQNLGAMEPLSGVQIGCGWWDEAQQVLWYTTFPYYSNHGCAVLHAVALHDDGTCTRYGPWFYQTLATAAWKRVCMYLTPIPAAYQPQMQGRTHLMGACDMSVSDPSVNWGLGLIALNLPPLREAVNGRNEAYFNANGNTFIVETSRDLSQVPLDGSVWLFVSKPPGTPYTNAQGTTTTEYWSDWRYYTLPATITSLGSNLWQITGSQSFRVLGTTSGATYNGNPSAVGVRLHWALVYKMADSGVPIADFTSGTSGLAWPYYFQRREADYNNVQNDYDLCSDPAWGTRTGEKGIACTAWNSPSYALPDPRNGEGFWQSSMDTVFTCIWIDRPTKSGVLMFGRQVFGGTWYHYWDTYATWGIINRATSDVSGGYGFQAEGYRRVLFEYDPADLIASASGVRPSNATGMRYVNGGNWGAQWPIVPLYRESVNYPGYSVMHPNAALGGGQMAMFDPVTNELIVAMPELYSATNGRMRPLIAVVGLP